MRISYIQVTCVQICTRMPAKGQPPWTSLLIAGKRCIGVLAFSELPRIIHAPSRPGMALMVPPQSDSGERSSIGDNRNSRQVKREAAPQFRSCHNSKSRIRDHGESRAQFTSPRGGCGSSSDSESCRWKSTRSHRGQGAGCGGPPGISPECLGLRRPHERVRALLWRLRWSMAF